MIFFRQRRSSCGIAVASSLLIAATLLWVRTGVRAQASDQLTIYSPQTTYPIALLTVNGQSYAGLVDALEPLGTIDARPDGKKYKLKFTAPGAKQVEAQFQDGKDKGKVRGDGYKLAGKFILENGRGYVPLSSLPEVMSKLLGRPVQLRAQARRMVIGEVAIHFTVDLENANPPKLLVNFSAPVNPTIAMEPGGVRFTFRHEPVLSSGQDSFTFNNPTITGAEFAEREGLAVLEVKATTPLLAHFADGGKTIIVTPVPPPPPAPEAPAPAPQPTPAPQANAPKPSGPRFLIIVDPAHGGADGGASITPSLLEKDVVLALGRRVQRDLTNMGLVSAMLRNSDVMLSLDQRAAATNSARAALYITLHAANTGRGVHVFTSLLPATNLSPGNFLPWDTAQAAFLDLSGTVAGSVAAELENRKLPNTALSAPLRPMNNIAAPAIAVELAPPDDKVENIASAQYQEQVAQAIAAGVAAVRSKLPAVRP